MRLKIEFVLPFFLAVLFGMNLCALIALQGFLSPEGRAPAAALPPDEVPASILEGISSAFLNEPEEIHDTVYDHYREPATRDWVISFFARICGSRDIAEAVLTNAENYNISPSLAFALCWEESRYHVSAINRHNRDGSIDRGLFQLNNRSFPSLTDADFFNPRVNAWYGMGHLRFCLDSGGSEIAALAMYNAGAGRVRSTGTPKNTLDYVSRILASRRKIDALFRSETERALEMLPGSGSTGTEALELGLSPDSEASPQDLSGDIGAGTALAKAQQSGVQKAGGAERSRFALLTPLSGL
ncbi:hypothetical protein AGMMS49546_19270 [Spirochaetia bacterium]|nr:hypothetical protein AGMMS49546_19270 [Spirochaetia bacterium]